MLIGVVIHPKPQARWWLSHSFKPSFPGEKKTPETSSEEAEASYKSLLATNLSQLVWPGNRPFQLAELTELAEKTPLASSPAVKHLGLCTMPLQMQSACKFGGEKSGGQNMQPTINGYTRCPTRVVGTYIDTK